LRDFLRRDDLAELMVTHDLKETFFIGDTISIQRGTILDNFETCD